MLKEENNNQLAIIQNETLPVPMGNNEKTSLVGKYAIDSNEAGLRATIKAALAKALIYNSRDMETADFTMLIDSTKEYILMKLPNIRLAEISLAIYNGSIGEYGKIYNINLTTVVDWLKQYMGSPARVLAFRENNSSQLLLAVKTQPSEHEIKQGKIKTSIDKFEQFKLTETFNDWGNYVFDSLFEFGIIIEDEEHPENNTFTDKEKNQCFRFVRSMLKARYTRLSISIDERHENKRKLDQLYKTPFEHTPFNVEVKKFLIIILFKRFIDAQVEIKDLLNNV